MTPCGEYFEDQRDNMKNQCQLCNLVDQPQNLDFFMRQIYGQCWQLLFCHVDGKGCRSGDD